MDAESAPRRECSRFQYPVEIPGVSNAYFMRAAYNEIRKARGEEEIDPMTFAILMDEKMRSSRWRRHLSRSVNTGFSGGEKSAKRSSNAVLEPRLAIPTRRSARHHALASSPTA